MNIQGFQKLTLLDYPGKMACTIFTAGCNLRCPFCHNSRLVINPEKQSEFSEEEIFSFLKKRAGILDGVAITGGEPLLQRDIEDFIVKVKELGYSVKLDTNGSFPGKLRLMIELGLVDYVAMDIKNSFEKYSQTAGAPVDINAIKDSISLLLTGKVSYEFRTTAVKELHTAEDFAKIGELIQGAERYFIQSYKDSGEVLMPGFSAPNQEELQSYLAAVKPYVPHAELRGSNE